MDTAGKIFDLNNGTPGTPIITATAGDDFSSITLFDRAYITLHNRVNGKASSTLYVYDGTTARAAAGVKPASALAAATGAAGTVEVGDHLISYAYETDTGFITKYATPIKYTAPGAKKIDLTLVANGPSGTAKKYILMSKVIPAYDGNPDNYELFFVPSGTINNNTTTTITIDAIDSQLVDSADYLLDQLETIPAGVFLCEHEGKLVIGGESGNESIARVSNQNKPESFSAIDGFITCSPGDGKGLKNGRSFKGNLYLFKSARTYATHDNGGAPSEWALVLIDSGLGAEPFSIGDTGDSKGFSQDAIIICNAAGLWAFTGAYRGKPMSDAVDKLINDRFNSNLMVLVDPNQSRVYIQSAFSPNTDLLYCDYAEGFDQSKWSVFSFFVDTAINPIALVSILGTSSVGGYVTLNLFTSFVKKYYTFLGIGLNDNITKPIEAYYTTGIIIPPDGSGDELHLSSIRARAKSDNNSPSSNLTITVSDPLVAKSLTKSILASLMDEYDYLIDARSHAGLMVQVYSFTLNHDWIVQRLTLNVKKLDVTKPL